MHRLHRAAGVAALPRHDAQPILDLGSVAAHEHQRARGRAALACAPHLSQPDALNCMFFAASPVKNGPSPFRNPGVAALTLETPLIRDAGPSAGV
jgi:hypothetical protein